MRKLILSLLVGVFTTGTITAQNTYSHTLPNMEGSSLGSGVNFSFPAALPTYGDAQLSFSWMACYQPAYGVGSRIRIQLRTGTNTYVMVYDESGNTSSCTFLSRTATITTAVFNAALTYGGGNTIHGDVRIDDGCYPGVGCSFSNDPQLTTFRLSYTVQSAYFTSPDATICPGEVVQFSNASLGSPTSFAWSFPGGVPSTSTQPNPVVQYANPGQYSATLTITNAEGTSTATRTNFVTVYAPPNAFAGVDQSFCAGGSAQLQATGGSTYQWLPTTGLSNPNIANPVASPGTSTLYTVIATSAQGCTASDAMQVTVVPAPTIDLSVTDPVLCGNDTLTITATGADLYTWSPNLFISSASGSTVEVWPPSNFTWTVTGNTSIGCTGQTTVSVTVSAAPATPVISWANMVLSSTSGPNYQWYLDGEAIAGATAQTWTPTVNGTYTVVVSNANGCSATSSTYFFGSTGVNTLAGESITLHPQPADEVLFVSGVTPGTTYRMFDAQGRKVAEGVMQQAPFAITTAHLVPGMHVLDLTTEQGIVRRSVVVE